MNISASSVLLLHLQCLQVGRGGLTKEYWGSVVYSWQCHTSLKLFSLALAIAIEV